MTTFARARRGWIVPETRLAVWLAVIAPLWLLSSSRIGLLIAIAATAAVGTVLVAELLTLPPVRSLEVSRDAPSRGGLGDEMAVEYTITNRWQGDAEIAIQESVPPALRAEIVAPLRTTMRAGQAFAESTIRPSLRGVHRLGSVSVRLAGRNRLLARTVRVPMDDEISVAPSLAPVRRFRLRALQARTGAAGSRILRQRGESLTFSGLRNYVPGDDPRRIDWKSTARQRVPITREYNLEQGQTILIAVDAGRLMTQTEAGVPRFEQALSSALVLATVAADAGDKVGLLLFDDVVRAFIPPRGGIQAVRSIRDALVFTEPRLVEPDYAAAFATIAARQRRRALIVLFSDVIDARSSRAIIAHTARSASRHLHVVAAMRSELLFRAGAPATRPSADSLFFNAAAEELVLAREEALQRMRASGVMVVDVAASAVSAAVVDRYLEIKARGAL